MEVCWRRSWTRLWRVWYVFLSEYPAHFRRLTVFPEALLNLPEKVGVTANLNINYKAPTRADQFIVIKVRLDEAQGRKSRVSGVVEDMAGNVLVEAK